MHRTSRILALTTLLLPQAPPCSSPRRRLFRTRWPIRCFCWLWRFSASGGKRCFRSGLHSSCLPWAMRRVRRVCSFRRCCFSRWPTVPISAISSAPGTSCPSCRMAASRGVARVALRRGRAPGLDPAERIGVAVYGAVIAGMLYSVLRYRGAYAAWFRFAALLFVFPTA